MGCLTLRATGPARPETVWRRYTCVDRWESWSPQIKAVHTADRRLIAGMSGTVESVTGFRVAFDVETVDHGRRAWTWRVFRDRPGSACTTTCGDTRTAARRASRCTDRGLSCWPLPHSLNGPYAAW